jgi:hypothetical protein
MVVDDDCTFSDTQCLILQCSSTIEAPDTMHALDAPHSQKPTATVSNGMDLDSEDSDDDLYGPYPPDEARPLADSQDRTDTQTYVSRILIILSVMLILLCSSRTLYLMKWIWIIPSHNLKVVMSSRLRAMVHLSESVEIAPSGNGNPQGESANLDLSHAIKGMYRILDLISEQGSGGLGKLSCWIMTSILTPLC